MQKTRQQGKFRRIINRPVVELEGYEPATDCKKIAAVVNKIDQEDNLNCPKV